MADKLKVKLTGIDGNVFSIIGTCLKTMRRGNVVKLERDIFVSKCQNAQSYDEVLRICMDTFDVE